MLSYLPWFSPGCPGYLCLQLVLSPLLKGVLERFADFRCRIFAVHANLLVLQTNTDTVLVRFTLCETHIVKFLLPLMLHSCESCMGQCIAKGPGPEDVSGFDLYQQIVNSYFSISAVHSTPLCRCTCNTSA